jgi:uncharacterized protein YjbI with pentapeptide repeats
LLCIGYNFPDDITITGDFTKAVYFSQARLHRIDFSSAKFLRGANFVSAEFHGDAKFSGAKFQATADFDSAKFSGKADFSDIFIKHRTDFNYVFLEDGKKILFTTGDLTKISFANTDITKVRFSETALWGTGDRFKIIEEERLEKALNFSFYWEKITRG